MQSNVYGRAVGCLVSVLAVFFVAGCNSASEDAGGKSSAAAPLDSCALLGAVGPDKILGEATDTGTLIVESHRENASVSQCQFAATNSNRTVGLLIRRVKGSTPPASRQAYFDEVREADEMGAGAETVEAMQAGREIAGLGDMALAFDLFAFNLMVWSGEHQFTVMLYGFGSGADAEERVVSIARAVLAEL